MCCLGSTIWVGKVALGNPIQPVFRLIALPIQGFIQDFAGGGGELFETATCKLTHVKQVVCEAPLTAW